MSGATGAGSEERFVEVAGNRLHVAVDGRPDRPWLTCLHALASNLRLWEPQVGPLGAQYRLLRIDARGHGRSTADLPASSLDDLAADVVAVWDALGIERSHVLGLSLGGMTGVGLALHHPGRVHRLVAADCRADAPPFFVEMWTKRQQTLREGGMEAVAEATLPIWFSEATRTGRPEVVEMARGMILGTSEPGYLGASTALKRLDYKRRLAEIRCPTLFLVGALDGQHPQEMREMAALVPGAEFVEIADAAHIANLEKPERFTEAALRFLRA
jgi:3-oxoadipate enol-lactonase